MEELIKKNSSGNIDNDNDSIKIIKKISPSNIQDYSKEYLISLINKEKTFFDNIDINALKLFDKKIFNSISEDIINNLTKESIEKLTTAEKIQYFNDNFLNFINKQLFAILSNSFFKQINNRQIHCAKKKIIDELLKVRKIHNFNKEVLKKYYKEYFNQIKEIKDIKYLLSKAGKNFEYLTIDNFIYLENVIGKYEELDYFLDKLKKFRFYDENENINTSYHKGVLSYNDIINDENIIIKNDEIKYRIDNYLSDCDNDNYILLKNYCIKCCDKDKDREIMIETLKEIINYPTINILQKIEHYKILGILIFVDKIKENQVKYYIGLLKLMKEINNTQIYEPCEFDAKINFFSEIINEGLFKEDYLEIIAEENLRNMKELFNTFFTGTDKTAIPEYLRNQHIKVINDYLGILKKKYKIKDDILIKRLQNISEDKENIEVKLNLFLKSISKYEKLYFDLLMQSIIEMPNLENQVESKANTLFKFIRDIGITVIGAKCASLTGSKTLTAISVGLGVTKILKNIKEEAIKSYFSLSDNQRRIYLMNQRNIPQTTTDIIKKKIKEGYRKIVIPIKKYANNFIRKKILKIQKEEKIGFDRLDLNLKDIENIQKECNQYRENDIDKYFEISKSMIEPQYNQILYKIKEKLKNQYSKKQSEKLQKFFNVKQKMIKYLINKRKEKLKKEYPEFDSTFSNFAKDILYNIKDFCVGSFNGLMSALSFNYLDLRIKDNKAQTVEKLIRGIKAAEYKEKLKKFREFESECSISTLKDDIQFLVKSTGDEIIFKLLEDKKETDEKNLEMLKNKFKTDVKEKSDLLIENENKINNNKTIKIDESYEEKNELLIKFDESESVK